jgi:NADH dehydrogenase
VALGSQTLMPQIPGLREHGYALKTLADAVVLRDRAIHMLEQVDASDDPGEAKGLLHFVVVGANFTGVEAAGEFQTFLRQASRDYRRVCASDCQVTLVEIADRILPGLDEDLSRYAKEKLEARGIRVRVGETVVNITGRAARLRSGEDLPTRTVIWCAGIAPPSLLEGLGLPLNDRGYLLCDTRLRVENQENIWGIGDCAVNIDSRGRVYPATAQDAVRQGEHLARNLSSVLEGREGQPADYRSAGRLVALGCRMGVAKIFGIKLSGFAAWFLWRTVYLMKMPSLSRRLRVALDWTADLIFRRDYVELGLHRSAERQDSTGSG